MPKPKIAPVRLPNGRLLYMEVDEDVELVDPAPESSYASGPPGSPIGSSPTRSARRSKGADDIREMATEKVRDLTEIMEGVAGVIPAAFRHAADVEIEKVTLDFGVKIGGEAGIPYLTKGKAEGNLGIRVECRYAPCRDKGQSQE